MVKNKAVAYTQPDGTQLSLLLSGDEYEHHLHDAAGYTILIDPVSSYAVYAVPEGTGITASTYRVGADNPASLGIRPGLVSDPQIALTTRSEHDRLIGSADTRAPSTGNINNLVIFVRFLDQSEYTGQLSGFDQAFNSTTSASMRGFFQEESGNQLSVSTTFYPPAVGGVVRSFQDGHNRGYFQPYSAANTIGYSTHDQGRDRLWAMMRQAIVSTAANVPASLDIDADNDGKIDNITFICQGGADTRSDILWPHHSIIYPYNSVAINGCYAWDYNLQLSEWIDPGVLSHEMSHSFGFPDLYHYTVDYHTPVGAWDPMEDTSNPPQHHLGYMKFKYGHWLASLPTITPTATATQYTLDAVDSSPLACYKIASSLPNEYYVIEYRRDTGTYESGIPASGLIVSRVISSYNGSELDGNRNGPPDEVYVYRPGINVNNPDGYIDAANLSYNTGRADMYQGTDPAPWLYVDASTQLPGNLVIMDIGAAGGSSITFWVRDSAPNIWVGGWNPSWDTDGNWGLGHAPTAGEDVVIKAGYIYDPILYTVESCRSLNLKAGGELMINTGTLQISGNASIRSSFAMTNAAANFNVGGDLSFLTGSAISYLALGAGINVGGDLTFAPGLSLNLANANLQFTGTGLSSIYCSNATTLGQLQVLKDSGGSCSVSASNSAPITFEGNIFVYNGSTIYVGYSGYTVLKKNLTVFSGADIACISGTLSFEGADNASIRIDDSGSYFYKLRIAKSGSAAVALASGNVIVNSDLLINSGVFSCSSQTLKVGGNWTNTVGSSGFYESTGRVVLNGTGNATLSSETFNILELSKTGSMIIPAGSTVICASYDWTAGSYSVSGGTFTVNDLADDGIFGTITLSAGTINYTQNAAQYIDLHGSLTITGGNFNLYGGGGKMWLAYQASTSFTLSGSGGLDVKNQGIFVSSAYTLNENITGGTIRCTGDVEIQRSDFNPTGGSIELYGTGYKNLICASGSNLASVIINKTAPYYVSNSGSTNLNLGGNLTISSGSFHLSGHALNLFNLYVNGNLTMNSGGSISASGNVVWNGSATISSGSISCEGNWTFGAGCTADLTGCTVNMNDLYGGDITNHSPTASFGNLNLNGTEENPVCSYTSLYSQSLRVSGNLMVNQFMTLNLNEGACTAGSVTIGENASLIVGDGGNLTIANNFNLNGHLNIGPGTVLVHGFFYFPASGSLETDYGSFTCDAPWLDMRSTIYLYGGIRINSGTMEISDNNVYLANHILRDLYAAILVFGRSFYATETGAYTPIGGELRFTGANSSAVYLDGNNYCPDLIVQKNNNEATVLLSANAMVQGNTSVNSGRLDLNGYTLSADNQINVSGELCLYPGSGLLIAGGQILNVNNGGRLSVNGIDSTTTLISRLGSAGFYTFNINSGGTISASYATFECMDSNGVNVHSGAIIDSYACFDNCIFRNGVSGGKLLQVNNSQMLTISGASFPLNAGAGSKNVAKTTDHGELTFIAYSGVFSGEAFEQDPYNRISWQAAGISQINYVQIAPAATPGMVSLSWDYPYPFTRFRIMRSVSPEGVYSQIGSSTTTNWSGVSDSSKAFYRVIAVLE